MIELIILGSGTGVPSPRRASPGYLVRVGSDQLLFDGGSGTLRRLAEVGAHYQEIDFLFYTHFHPDHSLDLVSFLFASRIPEQPREKKLHVIGPDGIENFYKKVVELYGTSVEAEGYELELHEVLNDDISFDSWKVRAREVKHIRHSVGYRIEHNGKILAYSGDTGYSPAVVELGHHADLFLLECSFPNRSGIDLHLTAGRAGQIAQEAGCKRLVLTHFYPSCDQEDILSQCREMFHGEVILAEDRMRFTIP